MVINPQNKKIASLAYDRLSAYNLYIFQSALVLLTTLALRSSTPILYLSHVWSSVAEVSTKFKSNHVLNKSSLFISLLAQDKVYFVSL